MAHSLVARRTRNIRRTYSCTYVHMHVYEYESISLVAGEVQSPLHLPLALLFFFSFRNLCVDDNYDIPLQYLAASHASLPRWVVTKLGKALVDVGKVSWPQEDPDFLTELMQLAG